MAHTFPVGIDIGSEALMVATPTTRQLVQLSSGWHVQLQQLLISDKQVMVALEPTGRHYSAPVITVLARLGALVLQVDHATTKHYRQTFVGPHKTDAHDADALQQIAAEWPRPVRGTKILDPEAESLTSAVRTTIEGYRRANKDQTRTSNRIRQLAHHIWPALAQHLPTYLRAVSVYAVTPAQLHQLAHQLGDLNNPRPDAYRHGNTRAALGKLIDQIPDDLGAPPMFELVIPILAKEHETAIGKVEEFEKLLNILISHTRLRATTEALRTVPRSSTIAIAALHAAAHCELPRYSPNQLRGALGFHPQRTQSGSQDNSEQAMKGCRAARGELHMWTMRLLDEDAPDNPVRDYWQARKASGEDFAFQAARGKLVRILAGIAQSGKPCNWGQEEPET